MLIVRDFFVGGGQRRFEQLRDSLGISRNILTERLKTLTEAGVIDRVPLQEGGKRCAYELTDKGRDLLPTLVAIMQWWDKWGPGSVASNEGPRFMNIRDREHGEEIAPITVRNSRDEPLDYGDLFITLITPRGEIPIKQWPMDWAAMSGGEREEVS